MPWISFFGFLLSVSCALIPPFDLLSKIDIILAAINLGLMIVWVGEKRASQ